MTGKGAGRSVLRCVLVVAVLIGCLVGAASALADGTITGQVTVAGSDGPATGVLVELTGSFSTSSCTDSTGAYTLNNVPAGTYRVEFTTEPPYCPGNYLNSWYKNRTSAGAADPVVVTDNQTTTLDTAQVQPGGEITGAITDTVTKAALDGATVSVYRTSGALVGSVCSASNGTYSLGGLPTGSYKVGVNSEYDFFCSLGGGSGDGYLTRYYAAADSIADADLVSVTQGQTASGVDVALHPGGTVSGTLSSTAGGHVGSGVEVDAFDSSGNQADQVCTDSSGGYSFTRLAPGSYRIGYSLDTNDPNCPSPGYEPRYYNGKTTLASADPVSVADGGTTANINDTLQPQGRISGTVTDAASADVANAGVTVYNSSGSIVTTACTSASGTYTTGPIADGSYKVGFTPGLAGNSSCPTGGNYLPQFYNGHSTLAAADPVTVQGGATTANINAQLAAGGQISGTVTAASGGAALQHIAVTVYDGTGATVASLCTNASGSYAAAGLPTGNYKVGFATGCNTSGNYLPQYDGGATTLAAATPQPVSAGGTPTVVDAALVAGGRILGTVSRASDSENVPYVSVTAYDADGNIARAACSANGGTYTIDQLPTGSYKVEFGATSCNYQVPYYDPQYYSGKDTLADAERAVPVTAGGDSPGVDATLVYRGTITGTVSSSAGGPANGIGVSVLDANGNVVAGACTDPQAQNGTYTIGNVPSGTYKLEFTPNVLNNTGCGLGNANFLPGYYDGKSTLADGDTVTVQSNQTTTANDTLQAGGSISGTATGEDGSTLADIKVTAYDSSGSAVATACTQQDGTYSVIDLGAGPYRLGFVSDPNDNGCPGSGNFAAQYFNGKATLATADGITVGTGQAVPGQNVTLTDATHELTVTASGNGTITSQPAGLSCTSHCSHAFATGDPATLTATPAAGQQFTGWSGDCSGTATCNVPTDADHSVTATFAPLPGHSVTVSTAGTGTGAVSSAPTGIACPGTCTHSFGYGTQVTLTATPAGNSTFAGWSGACTGTGACTVTTDSDQAATATFTATTLPSPLPSPPATVTHHLTTSVSGSGSLTSTPGGIACPHACTGTYASGTSVRLTAHPASGWTFAGWQGSCAGAGTCSVTLTADRAVHAVFRAEPRTPAPTCTVRATSDRVLLTARRNDRAARAKLGRLYVDVTCNQASKATLSGALTETYTSHHRRVVRKVSLGTARRSLSAHKKTQLSFVLPRAQQAALRQGVAESVVFTLGASNANGKSHGAAKISRLHRS